MARPHRGLYAGLRTVCLVVEPDGGGRKRSSSRLVNSCTEMRTDDDLGKPCEGEPHARFGRGSLVKRDRDRPRWARKLAPPDQQADGGQSYRLDRVFRVHHTPWRDMNGTSADATLKRRRPVSYPGSSTSERIRARRWAELIRRFVDLPDMRVIDLGGTTWDWTMGFCETAKKATAKPLAPKEVLVVNLDETTLRNPASWMNTLACDVCNLPRDIMETEFDLVFSNSLIEHVGGHWRRQQMAGVVNQLAAHHWVQTPWRYFPLEPHWMFPGFQFLPVSARAFVARRWPLTPPGLRGQTKEEALDQALNVELVSVAEMRRLFPTSELLREKVLGVTKSIIAVC